MASTKIRSIRTTANLAVNYIINPKKTNCGRLVSSFACNKNSGEITAKEWATERKMGTGRGNVLAKHIYQSFKPGEITAQEAHIIGLKFAEKLLKNNYQYVLATHIDKSHIHNHIIFNNIDMEKHLTFETLENRGGKIWNRIKDISDELCRENNLSVIEYPELGQGKKYYEWMMNREGLSWKARIKNEIDNAILNSTDWDSFLDEMQRRNVEVIYNPKHKIRLKFRMAVAGQQKVTRAGTLGWYYEEEQIRKRIEKTLFLKTGHSDKTRTKIIDTSESKYLESYGLNRWAEIQNMKETSKMLNLLTEYGLSSKEELEDKSVAKYGDRVELVGQLNDLQVQIDNLTATISEIEKYYEYRPYHEHLKSTKNKKKFEKENAAVLKEYNSIVKKLKAKFPDKRLPNIESLYDDRAELITERNNKNKEYKDLVVELKKLDKARTTVEEYLNQKQEKSKENNEIN